MTSIPMIIAAKGDLYYIPLQFVAILHHGFHGVAKMLPLMIIYGLQTISFNETFTFKLTLAIYLLYYLQIQ